MNANAQQQVNAYLFSILAGLGGMLLPVYVAYHSALSTTELGLQRRSSNILATT